MTAKCKTCGAALPAETIERMLERFEQCDERTLALFTVGECESDVDRDIIRNQWPALIRGLMAKADQRPVLTPETVDEIDPKVCEAVWQSFAPPVDLESVDDHEYEIADMGREMLRAVAAHCRVPMPQPSSDSGQLDSAEADRIIGEACKDIYGLWAGGGADARDRATKTVNSLRYRLTLKPRRLTDHQAIILSVYADNQQPALSESGHAIYAEALRLAGRKVEAPAPVTSVELSGAEHDAWNRVFGWDSIVVLRELNRILAARKAKDVADMQPPFEGPKHGFAVPDEANANVNGLTGGANGND